ncbi:P-loop containing nucleoside triphosphate hydrolase protein, partial [Trichophaea hybrida]
TGAGKSTIIQKLTNSDVHIGHSIKAGTNTFAMYPTIIDDQRYILIDTPGFNDGKREDVEIFCEILDWFVAMTPYCDLAGILYVYDISPNRSSGAAELNVELLQALCGERFYKNITIITTMWGDLS